MSRDKEPHFLAFNGEKKFVSVFGDQNRYNTLRRHPYPVTEEKKYQNYLNQARMLNMQVKPPHCTYTASWRH